MKKALFLVIVLCFAAIQLYAASPAALTSNGALVEKEIGPSSTYNGHDDSLVPPDTMYVLKNFIPQQGYRYVLARGATTNAGDSVLAYVYIESYCDNTLLSKVKVDSFTAAAAQEVALPFGETINGTKYNVIIQTYDGDGGRAKLNGLCVLKRRVVDFAKNLIF